MTQLSPARSWVACANGHADFPLQNLPLGIFSVDGGALRSGVAIGERIFDLQAALHAGLGDGAARQAVEAMADGKGDRGKSPASRGPVPLKRHAVEKRLARVC